MTPSPQRSRHARRNAAAEQLLERRAADATRRLEPRERRAEIVVGVAFAVVAAAMAWLLEPPAPRDGLQAAVLVVCLAALARVFVQVGAGFTVPTQVIFVPLLLLLPPGLVPALVAGALALSALPDLLLRRAHPERLMSALADSWFAVGPALLLALAGHDGPEWSAWPLYAAALAVQLAGDAAVSVVREWLGSGVPPQLQVQVMLHVAVCDALLTPVGLLAAMASVSQPFAFLLAPPLAAGLALFGRERARRIERALELVKEVRAERARTLRAQRRIGESFAASLDRDALRRIVLDTAVELVDADGGRLSDRACPHQPTIEQTRVGNLDGVEEAIVAVETALAERTGLVEATVGGASAMGHRLWREHGDDGSVLETLVVARTGTGFTAAERDLLRGLADQAAVSVENLDLHERFQRQAITDELTGLLNHRRLQEVLTREVRMAWRYASDLALVMLDIDDFKRVNDTYGHQQGDRVLREVSQAVRDVIRDSDHAARYGGEELAIALPRLDLDGARALAERLRGAIEALEVALPDGGTMHVSASLGVAALDERTRDRELLVQAADAALYRAKRFGKNRVAVAEASLSPFGTHGNPAGPAAGSA